MNRLGSATSPYLRQHADNPVHWQEWNAESLAWAVERDVPILLSIGYAACHWCHVMAHESFEDRATANLMNENFVCIKVDREERPDIDAVYMNATVAMTGQGGWPMTCFLTPEAEPFYCGTYFPKSRHGGMPSFTELLEAIDETWRNRRDDVQKASAEIVAQLRQSSTLPDANIDVIPELLDHAVSAVLRDEDRQRGGFGRAPKFPPSALLEGLLRSYERTKDTKALDAVDRTAQAMARGGIYDQVAGGFARYSVDADWVIPHFEKMLYDNALLLRSYAHLARRTGSDLARRVADETVEFLLADLAVTGGFASALDADTEGVEGSTYVWTPAQLVEVLGPDDGAWAAQLFNVTTTGTFEHGTSVLQLLADTGDVERLRNVRTVLAAARATRPQPGRDDKVVTAWNGMAITALAEAGAGLGEPGWIDAAAECARKLLDLHVVDGRLRRASLGGVVGSAAAVLEDHAWLATGLLALHQATGELDWLTRAQEILDVAIAHFTVPDESGSWFDTADDAETLVARPRDPIDGATPSGASSMAEALLTAAALSDPERSARYGEIAASTLRRATVILARAPRSAGQWLAVAEASLRGPMQIAVAQETASDLVTYARAHAPGGAVVLGGAPESVPLLADRPLSQGRSVAYVCRGFVCDTPVSTVDELAGLLAR
ncbi:thioredoxin domain-containing protein [Antrihabitans sp. YC2-6]|uniref:thioredoxin domain-containing protein n=1 Tax=Antrihabitans sp. YC2-6 TaxID=2799498 RepID=UPI0018F3B570|nr:thioredoxin domain-containing protein [Antrihabitans sp. YC2-6]MBJ8343769.1 thioredoxin domain-containing protein [Antrihabitans sp. YC2-6]